MFLESGVEGGPGVEPDLQADLENVQVGLGQQPFGLGGTMAVHKVKEIHAQMLG